MSKEDATAQVAHEQRYAQLIVELADALGTDALALKASGHLRVGGFDIGLLSYKLWDDGRITIFFDLGAIPAARQAEVHRKLLEQNLLLCRTHGAYAIIPGTNHGALVYTFGLDERIDGYALAENICQTLRQYQGPDK